MPTGLSERCISYVPINTNFPLRKLLRCIQNPVKPLRWNFTQKFLSKMFDWVQSARLNYTLGHQNNKTKKSLGKQEPLGMHIITANIGGKIQTTYEN